MAEGKVLLVLDGWVHPSIRAQAELRAALRASASDASFHEVANLPAAVAQPLQRFDALVLYFHHPAATLAPAEIARLRDYVRDGGGLLAVHAATASYKSAAAYFEILGGRFTGHGPVAPFTVTATASATPIFGKIAPFEIRDEVYLHELQPDLDIHFTAPVDGQQVPLVWTRTDGAGRVCYACPGHRSATLRHPSVVAILQRGFDWVRKLA